MSGETKDELGIASIVRGELLVQAAEELPKDSEFIIIIRLANGIQYNEFRCKADTVDEMVTRVKERLDKIEESGDGFTRTYCQGAVDRPPILRMAMQRRIDQLLRKFKRLQYIFCCFEDGKTLGAVMLSNVSTRKSEAR